MKRTALGLVLATFAGAAAAGDLSEPRYYDSNDYSAQVFYRVDFGGDHVQAQSVGLRFDSVRAQAAGAPAILQARFGEQGLDKLALSGVDLRGPMLSSSQSGGGFFGSMTGMQWAALIMTTLVFGAVISDVGSDDEADVSGTGGG